MGGEPGSWGLAAQPDVMVSGLPLPYAASGTDKGTPRGLRPQATWVEAALGSQDTNPTDRCPLVWVEGPDTPAGQRLRDPQESTLLLLGARSEPRSFADTSKVNRQQAEPEWTPWPPMGSAQALPEAGHHVSREGLRKHLGVTAAQRRGSGGGVHVSVSAQACVCERARMCICVHVIEWV